MDHKRRNRKKWKRSDSSDSVELMVVYNIPKNPGKFRTERKWKDRFCLPELKIFSGKWEFLKGRPEFPNGLYTLHLPVFTSSRPFGLDYHSSYLQGKKSWKWNERNSLEISI